MERHDLTVPNAPRSPSLQRSSIGDVDGVTDFAQDLTNERHLRETHV
jgi:hypothetical protein